MDILISRVLKNETVTIAKGEQMTCIVGVRDDSGNVIIGGDSAGVSGLHVRRRNDSKVFRVGEDFIIGYTSSFRMGQLLKYHLKPPEIKDENLERYMITEFVESVRTLFKDYGYSSVENNKESGGTFLVGVKGRIFEICNDFQVGEKIDKHASCGCGSELAEGAMFTESKHTDDIEKIAQSGLEAATEYSGGVCPPYIFLKSN